MLKRFFQKFFSKKNDEAPFQTPHSAAGVLISTDTYAASPDPLSPVYPQTGLSSPMEDPADNAPDDAADTGDDGDSSDSGSGDSGGGDMGGGGGWS